MPGETETQKNLSGYAWRDWDSEKSVRIVSLWTKVQIWDLLNMKLEC